MINVNELKPGMTFQYDGNAYILLESKHSKSGRGQAHVKTKVKNIETGSTTNITFTGGDKVEKAFVDTKEVQFLYFSNGIGSFMEMETYEQFELKEADLE
jgi:elongation factor P